MVMRSKAFSGDCLWLNINVFSQSSPPKQEKRGDSTTPVHQQAQKVDLPPTITIQPPNAGWDAMFFLQHPPIYFSQKEIRRIITLIIFFLQWGRWYFQWLRWRDGPSTLDPGRTSQRHHKQGHPEVNMPASLHPPRSFYQATMRP